MTNGVTPWIKVATTIGIPGALALLLAWSLVSTLPKLSERVDRQYEVMRRLLLQICVNTAPDDHARRACVVESAPR